MDNYFSLVNNLFSYGDFLISESNAYFSVDDAYFSTGDFKTQPTFVIFGLPHKCVSYVRHDYFLVI